MANSRIDIMDEDNFSVGAGPAIAARSKDASTPGPTAASAATGNNGEPVRSSETTDDIVDHARDGVERATAWVGTAAGSARATLTERGGRVVDQTTAFAREQPLAALALTGAICFALGVLLGRR
jgi:ElaB/YqjD/DUF883 family membrane-anchored ribosome-binding protein